MNKPVPDRPEIQRSAGRRALDGSPTPFATDEQIAARLRAVETELRGRGLQTLANEVAKLAEILDPQEAAA